MAGFASEVSITQVVEFFARFARFGGDMGKLKKLLGNDDLMKRWVEQLEKEPEFTFIHDVFNPAVYVLAAFKTRCAAKGIDFDRFSWIGSEVAPDFDPNDAETVVVLDATLDTLQNTFEFAWAWTVDGQEGEYRYEGVASDSDRLALLDGLEFKPWTLRWVRIKLNTNVGSKPIDVRDPEASPGCALLFMSAEHPERVKVTDDEWCFRFFLPGLKCKDIGDEAWRDVPYVYFDRYDRRVELHSHWCDYCDCNLSVPSFRE
jgi:hypothetical protein